MEMTKRERGPRRDRGDRAKGGEELPKEWTEKVVQIRRVAKVVKGGKKMSFRTVVVVGNNKGSVGVGVGKAADVVSSIQKAVADARKEVVQVTMVDTTIPHTIVGEAGASNVLLKPASKGTGVIAGGSVRTVLELAGIKDILSKAMGARSPLNNARATIEALRQLHRAETVSAMRGIPLSEMVRSSQS